ncbi:MAG: hypothetical protein ACP5RC_14350 [Halothiobacillaceae bacterium]
MTKPLLLLLTLFSGPLLAEERRLETPGDEPRPGLVEDDARRLAPGWDRSPEPGPDEGRRGGYGRGFEQRYGAGFGSDYGPAGRGFGGGGMGGGHGRR